MKEQINEICPKLLDHITYIRIHHDITDGYNIPGNL